MFEAMHTDLDVLVASVAGDLQRHRAHGLHEDIFQHQLIHAFIAMAARGTGGPSYHALAVYRLAVARERINELEHAVAMRDATLADLEALEGL